MIEKEQILLLTQGGLNVFSHFLGFEVNYGAQNEAYITKILPKPFIFNTFSPIL